MSDWLHIIVVVGVCWVVTSQAWYVLKTGRALGLFFDFRRDREPVRYWAYVIFAVALAVAQAWLALRLILRTTSS